MMSPVNSCVQKACLIHFPQASRFRVESPCRCNQHSPTFRKKNEDQQSHCSDALRTPRVTFKCSNNEPNSTAA